MCFKTLKINSTHGSMDQNPDPTAVMKSLTSPVRDAAEDLHLLVCLEKD